MAVSQENFATNTAPLFPLPTKEVYWRTEENMAPYSFPLQQKILLNYFDFTN